MNSSGLEVLPPTTEKEVSRRIESYTPLDSATWQLPPTDRRILGLKPAIFWSVIVLITVLLAIGIAVGAGVGLSQSKKSNNASPAIANVATVTVTPTLGNSPESTLSSSASLTSTATNAVFTNPGTLGSTFLNSLSPNVSCPNDNGTEVSFPYAVNGSSLTYTILCDTNLVAINGVKDLQVYANVPNITSCLDICSRYTIQLPRGGGSPEGSGFGDFCSGIAFVDGNCWLKNGVVPGIKIAPDKGTQGASLQQSLSWASFDDKAEYLKIGFHINKDKALYTVQYGGSVCIKAVTLENAERLRQPNNCELRNLTRYRCKFEHPKKGLPSSQNRFAALSSESPGNGHSRGGRSNRDLPYHLDRDTIINDISQDRPSWILSSYGPGRDAPRQLFEGPDREISFEELRLRHYGLASSGNQQQAIQEAQILVNKAEEQILATLSNIEGAVNYIIDGAKQHPNRLDICSAKAPAQNQPQASNPFGQPSAFGQPSIPRAPQALGFGKPSAFGAPASAFGQPASAFGQTPALGRPATSFGQQNSAFGQPSAPTSTFGQPSGVVGFGQPSNLGASQVSAFGQPSNPVTTNPLVQTSAAPTNLFARPAGPSTSAFGQTSQPPPNPFANAANSQPASAFGQPSAPSNPFAKPPASQAQAQPTGFGQRPNPQPSQGFAVGGGGGDTQRDMQNKLTRYNGKPVSYIEGEACCRRPDGEWEKIWFPDGPPKFNKPPDVPDMAYDESTKENYEFMMQQGMFKDGVMPSLPPKREWIKWDF